MKQLLLSVLFIITSFTTHAQLARSRTVVLMGAPFDITIIAEDSLSAERYIDTVITEISRIEYLISDWKPETQVSEINRQAGIRPVKADRELIDLTLRAIRISEITSGAFDISFAAMERIWKFDGSMTQLPGKEAVRQARAKVNYKNIVVDTVKSTVFLREKGMKIGFGALGEGYATDKCRGMMLAKGVKSGLINGSGDISSWGKQANGAYWNVGIADPFNRGELYGVVQLKDGAVTTSGSYEKYAEIDGKRYAHIINPATGYPATGLISVTVFGPDAETANALSTSIMVLGRKKGLRLLQQFPAYKSLIISDKGKFYLSPGLVVER